MQRLRLHLLALPGCIVAALSAVACNELPKRLVTGAPLSPAQRPTTASATPGTPTVVYAEPLGTERTVREIVVLFDEPMDTTTRPLVVSPATEGETRWMGEHTLVFVPRAPLAAGRYEATIAAGTRAKNGRALAAAHKWAFAVEPRAASGARARRDEQTRAPLLVRSAHLPWRATGGYGLNSEQGVRVLLNGPVQPEALAAAAKIVLPDGTTVPVVVKPLQANRFAHTYELKPQASIPRGVDIEVEVRIEAGLLAADARPALAQTFSRKFPTLARLRLWSIECPRSPLSPLRFYFDQAVRGEALAQALEIQPQVRLRLRTDDSAGRRVTLAGRFRAGVEYQVRVPSAFRGEESGPLGRARLARCTVPTPSPHLRFAVEGSLLEQSAPKQIPVWADLVPEVEVRLTRVPAHLAATIARRPGEASGLAVTHTSRVKAHARRRVQILVDPAPALVDGRGIVLVEVEGRDDSGKAVAGTRRTLLVNATDLGLTSKQSPSGTLVWVTRLSDGMPVGGVRISLRSNAGKEIGTATTGEDGVAEIQTKQDRWSGYYVVASHGEDIAWLRTDENQWMFMPSMFDVPEWSPDDGYSAGDAPVTRGLLFSERGIYRPGETVRLKGIVRREAAELATSAGAPAWISVKNAQDEVVLTRDVRLSEFGTFALDVPLSEGASLGLYSVAVTAGSPAWRGELKATFRVEEFRAPDFEVKLEPERRHYFPGETPRATLRGRYFFGAKMSGAKASWTVTSTASRFRPPHHEGFVFRPVDNAWEMYEGQSIDPERRHIVSDEGFLDERGEKPIVVQNAEPGRVYHVEGTVTGLDRTEISARTNAIVHPAAFYLGLQAEWTFLEMTETFRGDLVVVAPDGTRQSGVPIDAIIYEGDWDSVRRIHAGGTASVSSQPAPKVAARCSLRSGPTPVRCELQPKKGGYYVLWATAKDPSGRKAETSIGFYVLGPSGTAWAASDSVKMTLRADKHEYRVGDTARILVQNPFPEAEALVTFERDRILKRFRQRLVGSAPALRIPITEDLMPNVFVSVVVVRGRVPGPYQKTGDDPRRPLMRVGHALLRVSPESRRVAVEIAPNKTEYRPSEEVTVRLRTVGPDGKPLPTELTVWAVDEGVLSLVAYKTPDPVRAFAGMRGLAIMTSDSRYRALRRRAFEEKGIEPGGGGGSADPMVRKIFKAVAFFDPSVRTNARGEATVRFVLPDNMTTFRIMAVAVGREQRFGSGETKIVSTKRLLLQSALPRFVRAGDRIEAGVVVHNRTSEPGEARVRVSVQGLALEGAAERTVRLEPGRGEEVRFALRADAPGLATLDFDATLGRERDALRVTKRVLLATAHESVGLSGEAREAVRHVVGPIPDARTDSGGLELVVSGSRLAGLAASLAYLMEYPYGCGEQTTSGLLPLLALRDVADATGEALGKNVGDMIAAGLRRLATFQRDSGGFSLWPDASVVDPWVSGYILFALAEAKRRGHTVEPRVLERGVAYMKNLLRTMDVHKHGAFKANALYALAALGQADAGFAASLFDARAHLGTDGRAMLTRALVHMGDRTRATTLSHELVSEMTHDASQRIRAPTFDEAAGTFASPVRTKALVLEALAALDPAHPLLTTLAEGLLAAREGGRYRTTQESAFALFALASLERAESAATERRATIWVNGRKALVARFGAGEKPVRSLRVPMHELRGAAELVIVPEGGPVRYTARLVYAPRAPRTDSVSEGLAIHRTYERQKTPSPGSAGLSTPSSLEAAAGEMVKVTLHVAVPKALAHAVVDDALPAGLEAVNLNLATEKRNAHNGGGATGPFTHRELRDDRVVLYAPKLAPGVYRHTYYARATTPGRYHAPSVRAEGMYAPERVAISPATTLTIVPPVGGVASK